VTELILLNLVDWSRKGAEEVMDYYNALLLSVESTPNFPAAGKDNKIQIISGPAKAEVTDICMLDSRAAIDVFAVDSRPYFALHAVRHTAMSA